MSSTGKPAERIDATFTEPLRIDGAFPTYVELPGSAELLGIRRPVKVGGTIDGHEFTATLMRSGQGPHWLPVRANLRTLLGKDAGTEVTVCLLQRL